MKRRLICLFALLLTLAAPGLAQRATTMTQRPGALPAEPVTLQELNLLLRRQVGRDLSEANLAVHLERVGIAFDPTPEAISRLRANGAHQHLINTIKRAAERLSSNANSKVTLLRETPDPFLEETRRNVRDYLEELPDFICQQDVERFFDYEARGAWDKADKLTYELTYSRKKGETYKPLNTIGRPPTRSLEQTGGAYSTGDFASMLASLFDPETKAMFKAAGKERLGSRQTVLYDFTVPQPTSKLTIKAEGAPQIVAGYSGTVWIDEEKKLVLRLDTAVDALPANYPVTNSESSVDYDMVKLRGIEVDFLLPIRAEFIIADRRQRAYFRNLLSFKFYRKFETDVKISDDVPPPAPVKP
jgi:hypothetical protein